MERADTADQPKLLYAVPAARFEMIFPAHVCRRIAAACRVLGTAAPQVVSQDFLIENGGDVEVLITSWGTPSVDELIVKGLPKLKLVAHAAGSIKPIMSEAAWTRGIRATSAAAAIALGVAEFCLGLILTASKRVFWCADQVRQGYWYKGGQFFGPSFEIFRQNVGVIGASLVGRRLIELLGPLQCQCFVYDPYCSCEDAKAMGATKVATLDQIFSECRVVSLNAPATDETKGMIRGGHFAMLKEGSLFVNTARGAVVNQAEMVAELRKGRFVACLDVTWPEPLPIDHDLRRLPNVLITPHIAGAIGENLMRIGEFIGSEIERYVLGEALEGEVDPERLTIMA